MFKREIQNILDIIFQGICLIILVLEEKKQYMHPLRSQILPILTCNSPCMMKNLDAELPNGT